MLLLCCSILVHVKVRQFIFICIFISGTAEHFGFLIVANKYKVPILHCQTQKKAFTTCNLVIKFGQFFFVKFQGGAGKALLNLAGQFKPLVTPDT